MIEDRYGNSLQTTSDKARDAYIRGVDLFLAANSGAEESLGEAIAEDQNFALAHIALARSHQTLGRMKLARQSMENANNCLNGLSERELSHAHCFSLLIGGDSKGAHNAINDHLKFWPRDVMVAQPCTGVFGLIGFSGLPGRESQHLAFTSALQPHYGDDWWFLTQHGFAQIECGQIRIAEQTMGQALAGHSRNANAAHYYAHWCYEAGESEHGYAYLNEWIRDYDRSALLHCHVCWHLVLWALANGEHDTMWQLFEQDVGPNGAWGPPINIVTDTVAFLCRAEISGIEVDDKWWKQISDYAAQKFPGPGIAFVDVHAALAHVRAGNTVLVDKIRSESENAASDVVEALVAGFEAVYRSQWPVAADHLARGMVDHARIGGSRAQRDLLEFLMMYVFRQMGRHNEARLLLEMRRPVSARAFHLI